MSDSKGSKAAVTTIADLLQEVCNRLLVRNHSSSDPIDQWEYRQGNGIFKDSTQFEPFLGALDNHRLNRTLCQANHTWAIGPHDHEPGDHFDFTDEQNFVLLFNFWILGVLMPLIALFGIAANAASIVVLTRRIMRSSTINIYLAGLSAFDSLLLLMSLLLYPSLSFCELDATDPSSPWCRYFFYSALFTYPLSLIMQSCSVWTLTAITVDRFIAISWPLRSRKWCTCKRAYLVLTAITIWSIVYNLPAFFELKLTIIENPLNLGSIIQNDNDDQKELMEAESYFVLGQTDLRRQPLYKLAYKGYCYLFFMLLIPAGAMVVLNLIVSIKVRRAYRWRRTMSGKEEKERRCTIMAVLVVITFLVFNSLAFVNNMIEIFSLEEENSPKSIPYLLSVSVGNVLVALNSATNFIIYCALGLRFRIMFCKIFCMDKCLVTIKANERFTGQERHYQSLAMRYSARGTCDRYSLNGTDRGRNGDVMKVLRHAQTRPVDSSFEETPLTPNGTEKGQTKGMFATA